MIRSQSKPHSFRQLRVGLATLLIAAVALVAGCALFNAPIDAAKNFLSLIGQGKHAAAYKTTAPQWRNRETLAGFTVAVGKLGLDRHESSYFNKVNITGGKAKVSGTIRFRGGGQSPITVLLVKQGDLWLVYRVTVQQPGAARGDPT